MLGRKRKLRRYCSAALAAGLAATVLVPGLAANSAPGDVVLPYLDQSLPFNVRAADLVSRMTQEEKTQQFLSGRTSAIGAPAIERLGVHAYSYWNEALHGVARSGVATEFSTGLGIASTWDRDLVNRMTTAISDEARAKTNDCLNNPATQLTSWCIGLTYWSP
ncbi:MAG: hypothetical protein LBO20_06780, partial [Bifidobacteriaceae bacterium]|nr:hypothetical protein [Bifidobacteriaceae bacterium]